MIRIRVDRHQICPVCRTELVVDYFDDSAAFTCCPWCGSPLPQESRDDDLRQFLCSAVREIEQKVNLRVPVEQ